LQTQVEFSEQRALVGALFQQLRRGHLEWADHGVREIVGAERTEDVGAHRVAPLEQHRAARGTCGHRPGVAESDSGIGDLSDVRRGRRRRAAVSERLELVNADVVHDDEEDVGMRLRWFGHCGEGCYRHPRYSQPGTKKRMSSQTLPHRQKIRVPAAL
jgi:hypothetical protein